MLPLPAPNVGDPMVSHLSSAVQSNARNGVPRPLSSTVTNPCPFCHVEAK